jgi:hypothetical protein
LVLLIAVALSLLDLLPFFQRLVAFIRSKTSFSFKNVWKIFVLGREQASAPTGEYTKLVAGEPEDYDDIELNSPHKLTTINVDSQEQRPPSFENMQTSNWLNDETQHVHGASTSADRTSFDIDSPRDSEHSDDTLVRDASYTPRKIGSAVFQLVERSLVFAGFGQLLTGVVVYTGGCREKYINGCLAHLISAS